MKALSDAAHEVLSSLLEDIDGEELTGLVDVIVKTYDGEPNEPRAKIYCAELLQRADGTWVFSFEPVTEESA